jgi:hypothetical protein
MGWLSERDVVVAKQDLNSGTRDFVAKGSVGSVIRGNDGLWASLRRKKALVQFGRSDGPTVEVDDSEVETVDAS